MKKLNWLLMCVILAISTVSLVSCSDDDEDELNGDPSKLYGMWEPVHAEGYEKYGDEEESWNKDLNASNGFDEYYRVEFLDGNTYKTYGYYSGSWTLEDRGTFTLKGNTMYLNGDTDVNGTVTITNNQMVLESAEQENDNGEVYIYRDKVTYRKVN